MLRISSGFFSLLIFACFSWSAFAADNACPQRETILAFSDIVLADRAALPPMAAKWYGAEAAYLKIRYTPLSQAETRRLLVSLPQWNLKAADDLVDAWYIHEAGYKAFVAEFGPEEFDPVISRLGRSGIRALLLQEGGEDILMKRFAAVPFVPLNNSGGMFTLAGGVVSSSIVDQPDELKEKVALAAKAHGLLDIATYVSASENNPSAWDRFSPRGGVSEDLDSLAFSANTARAMVGNPRIEHGTLDQERIHHITMGMAFEPEQSFLDPLMWATGGHTELGDRIALLLMQQIKSGAIKRSGTLDAAWLFSYRSAVYFSERSVIESLLETRPYFGRRYVRTSDVFTIRDVIDRLLAVEALQPYVTGKASDIPPSPAGLSDKIKADWPRWTEMATKVRNGTVAPTLAADPATFGIVTELLFAKADQEALRAFVRQAPTSEARATAANDFAIRLDRACAAYLYHPAEALTFRGQSIFKFDTK